MAILWQYGATGLTPVFTAWAASANTRSWYPAVKMGPYGSAVVYFHSSGKIPASAITPRTEDVTVRFQNRKTSTSSSSCRLRFSAPGSARSIESLAQPNLRLGPLRMGMRPVYRPGFEAVLSAGQEPSLPRAFRRLNPSLSELFRAIYLFSNLLSFIPILIFD